MPLGIGPKGIFHIFAVAIMAKVIGNDLLNDKYK
jgi:hypothetical protein